VPPQSKAQKEKPSFWCPCSSLSELCRGFRASGHWETIAPWSSES